MKRCWFGAAALILLLVLGLILSLPMARFWEELGQEIALAAEDPAIAEEVYKKWNSRRTLAAVLCDHAQLEAIEENFRALSADPENTREICLRISAQLHSLAQSQRPTLENIF